MTHDLTDIKEKLCDNCPRRLEHLTNEQGCSVMSNRVVVLYTKGKRYDSVCHVGFTKDGLPFYVRNSYIEDMFGSGFIYNSENEKEQNVSQIYPY
jgi:hypothetical protein